jgi:flagellar hook protein FlgE
MSLNAVFNIASSGLNAAVLRQSVAGANIANSETPGYRRMGVSQAALPDGGVTAKVTRAKAAGSDLVEDVVSQIGALYAFKANMLSLITADRMAGTVINLRA